MKDLSHLKKDEIVKLYRNTEKELNKQRHLADSVRSKDKEMSVIRREGQQKVDEVKKNYDKKFEDQASKHETDIKQLESIIHEKNKQLHELIETHGALLKSLQGTVDNAVTLNSYMYDRVTGKGGK